MTSSRLEDLKTSISDRIAERQLAAALEASETSLRPGLTFGSILASLISVLILATPLAVAVAGAAIMILNDFSIFGLILGGVLLIMAWVLLPSIRRVDDILRRTDAPGMFGLIDAVADHMGAARIDGLVIDPNMNAFMARSGRKRERVMGIGVAL